MSLEEILNNKTTKTIAIIAAVAFYYFYTFGNYDVDASDEDVYFNAGINLKLPFHHFGNLLYPAGIYLLSKIIDNRLDILYGNFFILSSAMFVLMTFFLSKYSKSFWVGFLISLSFLFSGFQINLLPRITVLNLIFGLAALIIIDIKRPKYQNWGILALALLLCNYVSRPEFLYFFYISFILFVYFTCTNKLLSFSEKTKLLVSFLILFGLFYFIGGGVKESGKLKFAFTQHFFDNYQIWYGKKYDYFEELRLFDTIYGPVKSDLDLITANPSFFFKHVFTNIYSYIFVVIKMLKSIFYDNYVKVFGYNTIYFALAFIGIIASLIDYKRSFKNTIIAFKHFLPTSVYLIMFLMATLIAIFIIYPREHYVIIQSAFYLLFIAIIIKNSAFRSTKIAKIITIILPFMVIASIINLFPYPKNSVSNVEYYKFMQRVSAKQKLTFLIGDDFGYKNYFGSENLEKTDWSEKNNLVEMINTGKYDGIAMFRLNLEIPENRAFVNEGYKKTNLVRIKKFEPIQRFIWVKPELVSLFESELKKGN